MTAIHPHYQRKWPPLASDTFRRHQGLGGSSNVIVASYYSARKGDLGLWLAACLTTAVRGRHWSVLIGKGGLGGVIVVILAVGICVNHGPSTVGASLGFKESANKRPTKKGTQPTTDKIHSPLRCNQACIFECSIFVFFKPCGLSWRDSWESRITVLNEFLFSSAVRHMNAVGTPS